MVSAVVDTDTRLQAFARGADDYLTKPFSPKELIARVKRLLARSAETRAARARQLELEREASHARDDAARAHAATQREQRLRDLSFGLGLGLLEVLDEGELAGRLLPVVRARLGAGLAGLLLPEDEAGPLVPAAIRGDGLERLAGLELSRTGALATLLAGLERPVVRRDLERFPDLADDVAPFVAQGVALLVPLRGPQGLEGLLVTDERRDGLPFPSLEMELLAGLARVAGVALHGARHARALLERALEPLVVAAGGTGEERRARAEAAFLVEHAARATLLAPRERRLLVLAIRLGRGGSEAEALARLAGADPTGLARDIVALRTRCAVPAGGGGGAAASDGAQAAALLAVGLAHAEERARGLEAGAALARAVAEAGEALDPTTRQALEAAVQELALSESHAA
jgi:hypothetical protein